MEIIELSTKANTLKVLEGKLENAIILPQISFKVRDWDLNSSEVVDKSIAEFGMKSVIVRSSAINCFLQVFFG